ncbi:NAD(P)-binding protein [Phellopilus nigrolimitatus]|nr:NAD(P)-binding protein [Phellopilus nigrolimitatus]
MPKKLILVIGATGAQGIAVIAALLAPGVDGSPSPYAVRALTRDPDSKRAQALQEKGVECVKGSFEDFPSVFEALKGVYGMWVNTDGFTVGEARETYAGMRIYELAKQAGAVRHFVWSNLDYALKLGKYNPVYNLEHHNGKARVGDWLKAQTSDTDDDGMTWSAVSTGPYMEMLKIKIMFGPLAQRADGTFVFASPIGDGRMPMIALSDIGFFARYSFDHRAEVSGKDLEITSQMVGWDGPDGVVETFKRVTGQKAVFVRQTIDEWMDNFTGTDMPVGVDTREGSTTWKKNFTAWWSVWRDRIITRDMDWIKRINPNCSTLESWMRENNYTGKFDFSTLKSTEGGGKIRPNAEAFRRLAELR